MSEHEKQSFTSDKCIHFHLYLEFFTPFLTFLTLFLLSLRLIKEHSALVRFRMVTSSCLTPSPTCGLARTFLNSTLTSTEAIQQRAPIIVLQAGVATEQTEHVQT